MLGLQNRLRLLSVFVLLFFLLLVSKLYFIQIVSGNNFESKAEHQYVAGANYFDRGLIFFSAGDGTLVPAASIKTGFILYINPIILSQNESLEEVYETVNAIVPIDKENFLSKARKIDDPYEELARRLPAEIADAIQTLKISGLSIARERWRNYPGKTIAAHAIGLIGYSGNELAGRYGLERFYEPELKRSGDEAFINFFAEIFSNIRKAVSEDESLEGDIVTTIEPSVEAFLESEIKKLTEKYSSDFTGGIVINPKTGEIYAMALTPTLDPNVPTK